MATAKQAVDAIDTVLRLPRGVARWHADRLRTAGQIASTQGRPEQISNQEIARILISVLIGTASDTRLVGEYVSLRPDTGGPPLVETLAGYIDEPEDFFELRVDTFVPGATLTYRAADRGMHVIHYAEREPRPRPAFDRFALVPAGALIELVAAIKSAPPVRVGRRRVAARWTPTWETR
ncbi:hypothetical protein ACO2RV_18645 [Ancylobacter sp. VNQ12]|uniref:hypothetical protein n=1 Tax=Ancylobacter sp. VNQ12 TaxID=3400920 RepID=UPI003C0C7F42